MFREIQALSADEESVDHLLHSAVTSPNEVKAVLVNSTFGRVYRTGEGSSAHSTAALPLDDALVAGKDGEALVICNRNSRDGWQKEKDDAYFVLHNQLGLKVQ